MPEQKSDRSYANYISQYRQAFTRVMREHDISAMEMLMLSQSATNDPESESGKLAMTILNSIFDEVDRLVKK